MIQKIGFFFKKKLRVGPEFLGSVRKPETKVFFFPYETVVAQWSGTCMPLVLEVPGSIPANSEENFSVRIRFLLCHLQV